MIIRIIRTTMWHDCLIFTNPSYWRWTAYFKISPWSAHNITAFADTFTLRNQNRPQWHKTTTLTQGSQSATYAYVALMTQLFHDNSFLRIEKDKIFKPSIHKWCSLTCRLNGKKSIRKLHYFVLSEILAINNYLLRNTWYSSSPPAR